MRSSLFRVGDINITKKFKNFYEKLSSDHISYDNRTLRKRNFSSFSYLNNKMQLNNDQDHLFLKKKKFHKLFIRENPHKIFYSSLGYIDNYLRKVSSLLPRDKSQYLYGVNLIRVSCNNEYPDIPAPNIHQDGYDYSCHICIDRQGINGGISKIYEREKDGFSLLTQRALTTGEFILFDDRNYYHTASQIFCNNKVSGYRDMLIIDIIDRAAL